MGLQSAIVLSLLAVQAFAAPNGCIESCTSYHRTYQTQTSNGYQDHAGLTQAAANLDDLTFTRPGNWTEHNQYRTDSGHGNVHEERGQYVDGQKKTRYYKKNYTASYRSGNTGIVPELDLSRDRFDTVYSPSSQQLIDSQRGLNQYGNTGTTAEQHEYNRIHSIHSSSSRRTDQSQRLEDFGAYGGNSQQTVTGHESRNVQGHQTEDSLPANWSRVDSYRTDGGNGRVYEEEGQYVNGPKKVVYFKRNYTSSYTSGGIPIPNSGIPTTGTHGIHQELEKLQRELDQRLTNTAHRETGGYHSSMGTVGTLPMSGNSDQSVISSSHRDEEARISSTANGVITQVPYLAPTHERVYSSERHNAYERREGYRTQPDHRYVNPTPSDIGMQIGGSSDRMFRQETGQHTYDQQRGDLHQTTNINQNLHNAHLIGVPTGQVGHFREHWSAASHTKEGTIPTGVIVDDTLHRESAQYNRHHQYDDQQSAQSTLSHASYQEQLRQNNYNSGFRTTSGKFATGALQMGHVGHSADCNEEHAEQVQYGSRYHRAYKRSADYKDGDEQLEQQTTDDFHPMHGKLEFAQQSQYPKVEDLTQQPMGKLDLGQERDYHYPGNKPKYSNEVDDLTQQTTGQLEFGQHTQPSANFDEFSQQSQHDTQKPSRLSIPSISKPYSDFSQQHRVPPTTGTLEFGSQNQRHRNPETPSVGEHHLEDLTEQNEDLSQMSSGFDNLAGPFTSSQPERNSQHPYGAQRPTSNGHLEDLTSNTGSSHDMSQQSNTGLEFGQHSQHPWQPMSNNQHRHRGQDFTQDEDFTQQTGGFEDLSQQTGGFDDYSQQMSGKLEFGHQTRYPGHSIEPESSSHHREDLAQHNEDFTQQTTGKLEFGQQEHDPHQNRRPDSASQIREDLSQQSQDLTQQSMGKLEFGQQKPQHTWSPTGSSYDQDDTHQWDDLTQQTSGKLEFGQQTQDLPQQSMGKLEFGQQKPQHTWSPTGSSHDHDDTHQWDDLTQQTSGKLEFGQQTQNAEDFWKPASASQHRGDTMQQGQDFTQQTGGFHDLSQQASDKLELGQQTQQQFHPWDQLSDLTQKNEDLTQQTTGHLEFGQHDERFSHHRLPYHHRDSTQETQGNEDFSQQTGHFGHGPYQQQHKPSASNTNNHIFESQSNSDMHQQTAQHESGNVFQLNDNYKWGWKDAANLEKPDSSQQTLDFGPQKPVEEPVGVIPLEQHGNIPQHQPTGLKPAEKPKPRPRYSKPVIITPEVPDENLPSVDHPLSLMHKPEYPTSEDLRADQEIGKDKADRDSDKQGQQQVGAFDIERGNGDQVNWLHKSNDATVGLQWHYTYHPSDLTNSEPGQSSYYPQMNYNSHDQHRDSTRPKEEQSALGITDQQESGDRTVFGRTDSQSVYRSQNNENTQINNTPQRVEQGVKGRRRPNMLRQASSTAEPKLEPRILEAYGGGPYDGARNDDIYSRVTPNPSATLPPLNAEDPWDIREKPRESLGTTIIAEIETESTPETTEPEELTTIVPPPTFWGRLGHKITNTFDKARDKARGIFG